MRKYNAKIRKEVQGTGLGGQELTEYETLLEDLIERYRESELKSEQEVADKKSIEKDKQTALDIRKTAMEWYGETKKHRKMEGDGQPKEKKSRRPSSDILSFLQEKLEFDRERLKLDSLLPKKILFICFNESPLKIVKNAFYFILKTLFILKIFKVLSWHFGHAEETA